MKYILNNRNLLSTISLISFLSLSSIESSNAAKLRLCDTCKNNNEVGFEIIAQSNPDDSNGVDILTHNNAIGSKDKPAGYLDILTKNSLQIYLNKDVYVNNLEFSIDQGINDTKNEIGVSKLYNIDLIIGDNVTLSGSFQNENSSISSDNNNIISNNLKFIGSGNLETKNYGVMRNSGNDILITKKIELGADNSEVIFAVKEWQENNSSVIQADEISFFGDGRLIVDNNNDDFFLGIKNGIKTQNNGQGNVTFTGKNSFLLTSADRIWGSVYTNKFSIGDKDKRLNNIIIDLQRHSEKESNGMDINGDIYANSMILTGDKDSRVYFDTDSDGLIIDIKNGITLKDNNSGILHLQNLAFTDEKSKSFFGEVNIKADIGTEDKKLALLLLDNYGEYIDLKQYLINGNKDFNKEIYLATDKAMNIDGSVFAEKFAVESKNAVINIKGDVNLGKNNSINFASNDFKDIAEKADSGIDFPSRNFSSHVVTGVNDENIINFNGSNNVKGQIGEENKNFNQVNFNSNEENGYSFFNISSDIYAKQINFYNNSNILISDDVLFAGDVSFANLQNLNIGDKKFTIFDNKKNVSKASGDNQINVTENPSDILNQELSNSSSEVVARHLVNNDFTLFIKVNKDGSHGQLVIDKDMSRQEVKNIADHMKYNFSFAGDNALKDGDVLSSVVKIKGLTSDDVSGKDFFTDSLVYKILFASVGENGDLNLKLNERLLIDSKFKDIAWFLDRQNGDLALIQNEISSLNSVKDRNALIESLLPVNGANIVNLSSDVQNNVNNILSNHNLSLLSLDKQGVSSGDVGENKSVWGQFFTNRQDQENQADAKGYKSQNNGFILGLDRKIIDNVTAGVGVGYSKSDVDYNINSSTNSQIDNYHLSLYGVYDLNKWFADAMVGYGLHKYDSVRKLLVNSVANNAKASWDGQQYSAKIGGGYRYDINSKLQIIPLTSLSFSHLAQDAYNEHGSGANLHIKNSDNNKLEAAIGSVLNYKFIADSFDVVTKLIAQYKYDFINDNGETSYSFIGTNGTFLQKNAKIARNRFDFGLGADLLSRNNVSVSLDYNLGLKQNYQSHTGMIKFKYNF